MQADKVKREIEPTMQTFDYKEYEDDDNSDSANIMIDNNGDIRDIHAWGTIWYEFTTEKITSPMLFNLLEGSQTESTLLLQWTKDPCLPNQTKWAINIKISSDNGKLPLKCVRKK